MSLLKDKLDAAFAGNAERQQLVRQSLTAALEKAAAKDAEVVVEFADPSFVEVADDGTVSGVEKAVVALKLERPHFFREPGKGWAAMSHDEFQVAERKFLDGLQEKAVAEIFGDDDEVRPKINKIDAEKLSSEQGVMLDRYMRGNASSSDISALLRVYQEQHASGRAS